MEHRAREDSGSPSSPHRGCTACVGIVPLRRGLGFGGGGGGGLYAHAHHCALQLQSRKLETSAAKRRTEKMLLNVLPPPIVKRLYNDPGTKIIDTKDSASVLFASFDIVDSEIAQPGNDASFLVWGEPGGCDSTGPKTPTKPPPPRQTALAENGAKRRRRRRKGKKGKNHCGC